MALRPDPVASPPASFAFERGLLSSLEQLALRCALVTVLVPLAVFVGAVVCGHQFFVTGMPSDPNPAIFALALASYFIIPMLALTGAFCSAVVTFAIACSDAPGGIRITRGGFLVAVAVLGLLLAIVYDVYLLPDLLR